MNNLIVRLQRSRQITVGFQAGNHFATGAPICASDS